MDRLHQIRRSTKAAWMLLALAVVSVLAPVWANSYLCPMAREALESRDKASCCEPVDGLHGNVLAGEPRLEPPCDCPQLSWSSDAADQTRESRSILASGPAFRESAPSLPAPRAIRVEIVPHPDRWRLPAAQPAWILHQAILC